jgi:hypothetical protein
MNIPKIELSQIPGLEGAQALFGTVMQAGHLDDRIIEIMIYMYIIIPPESGLF